jgi:hypothetical protein
LGSLSSARGGRDRGEPGLAGSWPASEPHRGALNRGVLNHGVLNHGALKLLTPPLALSTQQPPAACQAHAHACGQRGDGDQGDGARKPAAQLRMRIKSAGDIHASNSLMFYLLQLFLRNWCEWWHWTRAAEPIGPRAGLVPARHRYYS